MPTRLSWTVTFALFSAATPRTREFVSDAQVDFGQGGLVVGEDRAVVPDLVERLQTSMSAPGWPRPIRVSERA